MNRQIEEGRQREQAEQLEMFPDIPEVYHGVFFGEPTAESKAYSADEFLAALERIAPGKRGAVTFEEVAQDIYDECFDLLVQRQVRYGPSNISQQGPWGVLSRIANDKIARIKRAFNGRVVHGDIELDPITDTDTDESFEDAVKDLVNYGVILLLLHRGKWGFPLESEVAE